MKNKFFITSAVTLAALLVIAALQSNIGSSTSAAASNSTASTLANTTKTKTPITHIVVIFQENVSYDHYFATYPNATNPPNEPQFKADKGTPSANGLTQALIDNNPNSAKPFRLDRSKAITCDQNHEYRAEQQAYNGGLLDKFVQSVGAAGGKNNCDPRDVMGYYDGNTVTALWNYAQHFSMSDNSFSTTFGPSTPGMLNLVAGQTHGATPANISDEVVNGTVIGDPDGAFDDCSRGQTIAMSGKNIGDLLNEKGITWGWFQGGFRPSGTAADGRTAVCGSSHLNIAGQNITDYSAHHQPFQYYRSTSNPHHLPPSSVNMIGHAGDQANHQYDISDFWKAADSGNMPAVSFLKAPRYQDGHAGYSDPLDEQTFLVSTINHLQKLPEWKSTAVIIAYDDSDGWYDHVMPPIINHSSDPKNDALLGSTGMCGTAKNSTTMMGGYQDRCGYGPRQPLLVISPYSKVNYVDHQVTDQTSILKFIEDNWNLGTIGDSSFDAKAGTLMGMFNFGHDGDRGSQGSSSNASPIAEKKLLLFLDEKTGMVIEK
jgi:phospholipase C